MSLSCGIVGLPNAGKSTLFNALLKKQQAVVANYPFTTIEPNLGIVPVPDPRLTQIGRVIGSEKITAATVRFVDIAGLVKNAHKGEGLGNQFLGHIREVELICLVLRQFADPQVIHVTGEVDPQKDREIIDTELIMADLGTIEKSREAGSGFARQNENEKFKISATEKLHKELNSGKLARDVELTDQEKEAVSKLHLLTMKPMLYVVNVSETALKNVISNEERDPNQVDVAGGDPHASLRSAQDDDKIFISAKIEGELAGLSEAEQKEYLKLLGLQKSGLERLIYNAYQKLGLITFYSGNAKETHAWAVKRTTQIQKAAGVVHTDFEKGFIKAEVINWQEFVNLGGWQRAREQGKVRLEGRNYLVQDGDVVDFKVNPT